MGLSENILKALEAKGFEEPSQIQEQTIPLLLNAETDLVGQAQTGTGKTAAFGIPIIERLDEKSKQIGALILTPTRELALQVADEINSLKGEKKLKVLPVYGGQGIELQIKHLKKGGIHIVVGTPGRIIDHLERGTLKLDGLQFMILDEADEMLNMGFIEDVEKILAQTPEQRRVLLFSATMPQEIMRIAKKYMKDHKVIKIQKKTVTTDLTEQIYFEVSERDKFEALCRILDMEVDFYGIIFCRTKHDVDTTTTRLIDRGYDAEAIHGDITQGQREKVLSRFKNKKLTILVATDVAARGIDVNNLTHVINYSLPQDPEAYVHRIGRTGRAGKEGTAITFVTPDEYRKLMFIKRIAKTDIKKQQVPEINEVIEAKKDRIRSQIMDIMDKEISKGCHEFARDLLLTSEDQGRNLEDLIAAMVKFALNDELEEKSYAQIKQVKSKKAEKARLFIGLGKKDKINPKKLVDLICQETRVPAKAINDVAVFDKFSFMTVSGDDANTIIDAFRRKKGKNNIHIERAKEVGKRF
jgi:ATP-dependent RNA helicase DeaD